MALVWHTNRIFSNSFRTLSVLTKTLPICYSQKNKSAAAASVDLEVDALDSFTSELMQKKVEQWTIRKAKRQAFLENSPASKHEEYAVKDIARLSQEEIGNVIQSAFDNDNSEEAINMIKLCVEHGKCPPVPILLNTLTYCAQNGHKDIIVLVQELCLKFYPKILKSNSNFDHFAAEAIWSKGNVHKAIELFDKVYRENAYLRRRVRLMLKYLIVDLVNNRSEATLWVIIDFSEKILRDFNDFYPVSCVWQACFLSEWFTDQCIALELLERNNGLCKSVIPRIPYVVFVSLKCHRTEVVYRLLEILLAYEMKQQYSQVLVSLLEYQFRNGDFASCSEIIRWTIDNNVSLPEKHHLKLLNLLLHHKLQTPIVPAKPKTDKSHKFSLKF